MTNLLPQAINCDNSDRAAKIIQNALGIITIKSASAMAPMTWYWWA